MLVTKYKNRLFFSFLFVVYSGAYVEAQTNEKAPIFHDFSMFSMEEMGIPRWGNGQREDLFRTDPTKIKDAYFFETTGLSNTRIPGVADKYKGDVPIDYYGFKISDDFVIGYGLDYDGLGRNLKHIYTITE